jgi:hypothetical protein
MGSHSLVLMPLSPRDESLSALEDPEVEHICPATEVRKERTGKMLSLTLHLLQ